MTEASAPTASRPDCRLRASSDLDPKPTSRSRARDGIRTRRARHATEPAAAHAGRSQAAEPAGRGRPAASWRAQLARFLSASVVATACQYAALLVLVELRLLPPVAAASVGYGVGALANYQLRRRFVFRSRQSHAETLGRYLAVVVLGMLLTTLIVAGLTDLLGLHYMAAQVAATSAVFFWNFAGHRWWTYIKDHPTDPRDRRSGGMRRAGQQG